MGVPEVAANTWLRRGADWGGGGRGWSMEGGPPHNPHVSLVSPIPTPFSPLEVNGRLFIPFITRNRYLMCYVVDDWQITALFISFIL